MITGHKSGTFYIVSPLGKLYGAFVSTWNLVVELEIYVFQFFNIKVSWKGFSFLFLRMVTLISCFSLHSFLLLIYDLKLTFDISKCIMDIMCL